MDENGIMKCDKCNGTGMVNGKGEPIIYSTVGVPDYPDYRCKKCMGSGRLTWIENLFGRKFSLNLDVCDDYYEDD